MGHILIKIENVNMKLKNKIQILHIDLKTLENMKEILKAGFEICIYICMYFSTCTYVSTLKYVFSSCMISL